MKRSGDDLEERLLEFAARIGKVVDALPNTRMGRHIAGQLVRSGTSPAPNYSEACGAESKKDFVHKLGICLKELRESRCGCGSSSRASCFLRRAWKESATSASN